MAVVEGAVNVGTVAKIKIESLAVTVRHARSQAMESGRSRITVKAMTSVSGQAGHFLVFLSMPGTKEVMGFAFSRRPFQGQGRTAVSVYFAFVEAPTEASISQMLTRMGLTVLFTTHYIIAV